MKKIYKSKTLWLSAIGIIGAITASMQEQITQDASWAVIISCAIFAGLRFITKTPIGIK